MEIILDRNAICIIHALLFTVDEADGGFYSELVSSIATIISFLSKIFILQSPFRVLVHFAIKGSSTLEEKEEKDDRGHYRISKEHRREGIFSRFPFTFMEKAQRKPNKF